MKFVNRKQELNILQEEYEKENSFVVLYGLSRLGKTTLIQKFIEGKKAFYFFADKQNERMQIRRFQQQMAQYFQDDLLRKLEIYDWESIFDYFLQKIGDEKIIFVIDEFPYLCMGNKGFSSIFQRIYDEKLLKKNLMIILCGSLISMMYSEVLAYSSPLFGRRTAQIKLQAVSFPYYKEFFLRKTHHELIEMYSLTGGIPKYILSVQEKYLPLKNIKKFFLDRDHYLYSEPKFLLQEEVNEMSRYFAILHSISLGNTKLSKIASHLALSTAGISAYISKLIDLDLIEKEIPVGEKLENTKKSLYYIKDNYLRFWFCYIYPYQSYLEIGNLEYPFHKIEKEFDVWVSKTYENLCRESILYSKEIPFPLLETGRWWDKNTEIDILGLGEKEIVFGECKWSKKKVGLSVLQELQEKAKKFPKKEKRVEYYILFSKSGFTNELISLKNQSDNIILSQF